jgi:cytosol alanyl aminopeptidase
LVAAGQMPASDALALVPKFKDASEPELILAALDIAQQVRRSVPPELKPNYARFMTAMFSANARLLGFEPRPGESDDDRILRSALVPAVAEFGDQELIAKAKELASRWLADRKSVSADVAGSALNIAAANGDEKYYERLVAELRKSTDRRDRARIVGALGSFRNAAIARQALNLLLDPSLDVRDLTDLLFKYNAKEETETLAWTFMVANYDKLLARLPSRLGNHAGSQLPLVGGAFCDERGYAEVESFFKERVKSMPGAELSLAQVLEKIQLCGPRRAAQRPGVAKFLTAW